MNVFDKKRKIYNSNEHNSNNNVAKCHILINYWCSEYGIDYSSYNRHNNSCIHFLDNNNIKGAFEMTEKYKIIWDFCDWLGYQGLAYETLYYGGSEDIDKLIKRYLEDEEWFNRKELQE